VLASYDGRLDLESRGAVLFREFITEFSYADLIDAGALFAEPFDATDPVGTPRGLASHSGDDDRVLQNLALEFTDNGPRAAAMLTYSESGDPDSPHFTDQTPLFSTKQWRPILFRKADIDADGGLRTYEVTGSR
jgi:acyl-homoserine lactone acylase PvdQ